MLKKLIDYQHVVKTVYIHNFATISAQQRSSLAQVNNDHDGWEILQCLTSILEPFELATRSLCAQQYPTLSLAYTTIKINSPLRSQFNRER